MAVTPGLLVCNPWVTVKKVNEVLRSSGYVLKFGGYAENNFPVYRFDRLPRTKHPLLDPYEAVYSLGDYTPKEWLKILNKKLKATSPAAYQRAKEKRYRANKRSE